MSQLAPSIATCPRCARAWSMAQFSSLDADTIQAQVDPILDGIFERQTCSGCGHAFRPEHTMPRAPAVAVDRDVPARLWHMGGSR